MAHVMKHTKASCGHMFAHFDRRADHIGNENVDRTRTHLNYNLATHQQMEQGEFVRQRCSEVRCQNRKDVNVMVSWIVTAPSDLDRAQVDAFMHHTYDFLEERYGKENVVSAYVHMDEVNPHMHFAFVPVAYDPKRNDYKVSAKEVVTRTDLRTFHEALESHLEQKLGCKVGILNEATREGNKSVKELKRGTAQKQLKEIQKKLQEAQERLKSVESEYWDTLTADTTLKREMERLRDELAAMQQEAEKAQGKAAAILRDANEKATGITAMAKVKAEQVLQEAEQIKAASVPEQVRTLQSQVSKLEVENYNLKLELQGYDVVRERFPEIDKAINLANAQIRNRRK